MEPNSAVSKTTDQKSLNISLLLDKQQFSHTGQLLNRQLFKQPQSNIFTPSPTLIKPRLVGTPVQQEPLVCQANALQVLDLFSRERLAPATIRNSNLQLHLKPCLSLSTMNSVFRKPVTRDVLQQPSASVKEKKTSMEQPEAQTDTK